MYAERIVGLREGIIVYDGSPDALKPDILTEIYGKEGLDCSPQTKA